MAFFSSPKSVPTTENITEATSHPVGVDPVFEQKCENYERAFAQMAQTLESVLAGNLQGRLTVDRGQGDHVARAFQALNDVLDQSDRRVVEAVEKNQQSSQALTSTLENKFSGFMSEFAASVQQLSGVSEEMKQLAVQNVAQSRQASTTADEATGNVNAVASATEELSSSINEITSQVNASSTVTKEAVKGAASAGDAVKGLEDSANQIDRVVELIRTIAGQTNLLALNATIEAARAGEAGKGFAVVASEVKNLANETSSATDDIVAQVENIQSAIKHTVQTIEEISTKINQVDEYSAAISATITQQNAATMEISRNIQQAARGTSVTSEQISEIYSSSENTSRMADEVYGAADKAISQIETLKREVGTILHQAN
ncbi:methyl-accepting chemotaxis protein [Emcibacter sp.]|uniref:methyl-accepting chemotaxis protein n=1 Tax=Emcibacter sp. TaxID=1979954 RepID=UPI002AA645D2|nr:methyl-accepting chemotaxis protein [Emcibacter sp.]